MDSKYWYCNNRLGSCNGNVRILLVNCWHCQDELIWGGDHDLDDDSEFVIESNFSCATCGSVAVVYFPRDKDET